MEGWLTKQKGSSSLWDRKYFVLNTERIIYLTPRIKGNVLLSECKAEKVDNPEALFESLLSPRSREEVCCFLSLLLFLSLFHHLLPFLVVYKCSFSSFCIKTNKTRHELLEDQRNKKKISNTAFVFVQQLESHYQLLLRQNLR